MSAKCHNLYYSRKAAVRVSLALDDNGAVIWRAGILTHVTAENDIKVCSHHDSKLRLF